MFTICENSFGFKFNAILVLFVSMNTSSHDCLTCHFGDVYKEII